MRLGPALVRGAVGLTCLGVLLVGTAPASSATPPATSVTHRDSCAYVRAHLAQYAAQGIRRVACVDVGHVVLRTQR